MDDTRGDGSCRRDTRRFVRVFVMREPDWQSESGDIQLYCGDCLKLLPEMEPGSVDAVVTDPPYGIGHKSHGQLFKRADPIAGDADWSVAETVINWAARLGLPVVSFFSPYNPPDIAWRSVLVWSKGAHVGIGGDRETCWKRDFELIGVWGNRPLNGQRDSAVLAYPALLPPPTGHVAEKPVELLAYLVCKVTQPGDTAFDPYMGSGTTAVACVKLGRKCIGIEIEPKYFEIAVRRVKAAIQQGPDDALFKQANRIEQPLLIGE